MKKQHPIHVVLVTIDTGNVLDADDVVRVNPDDQIVFVIVNNDLASNKPYWVWVDPAEIKQREDVGTANPPTNPLQTNKEFRKVNPGEVDFFKHKVRKKADFGKGGGQVPYTTYKYTIRSSDVSQYNGTNVGLDPDIDVVTP